MKRFFQFLKKLIGFVIKLPIKSTPVITAASVASILFDLAEQAAQKHALHDVGKMTQAITRKLPQDVLSGLSEPQRDQLVYQVVLAYRAIAESKPSSQ